MKGKVASIALSVVLIASVGWASPLTDYSQGKVSVDVISRPDLSMGDGTLNGDGKSDNMAYDLTVGLGHKWAIQYQHDSIDSKSMGIYGYSGSLQGKAEAVNVLYKLDKNVAAFAGWTKATADISGSDLSTAGITVDVSKINGYQAGFVGTLPLQKNLTAFSTVGFGNKITNYELGMAYQLDKNLEFNVGYRYTKYKGNETVSYSSSYGSYIIDSGTDNFTIKGMECGITYKF